MAYNFEKLEELLKTKGVGQDEITDIIAPLRKMAEKRRYGLVWEEPGDSSYEKDQAEQALEKAFAFLKEVPERRIEKAKGKPMNLLIEGDNYHSLKALQYTHRGLVDVIYVDPPYNTGNRDFVYNDRYVDSEDSWRHSSWLSFMNKRLRLARDLMSEDGVIFISIDDNEQAQLKLLCDQVFGELNFIGNMIWKCRVGANDSGTNLSTNHEYILVYGKNKKNVRFLGNAKDMSNYQNPDNDPNGPWMKDNPSAASGSEKALFEIVNPYTGQVYLPPTGRYWAFGEKRVKEWTESGKMVFPKRKNLNFYIKKYVTELKSKDNPNSTTMFVDERKILTSHGTKKMKEVFPEGSGFKYPKPVELIKKLISLHQKKNAIVVDFFAGSGTTGHSVMELNEEDGGNRQFILCTNNENNICEEVTYERLNRVINGYTTPKNKEVAGIPNNLAYYKVDLLADSGDSDENRLQAIHNAVDLIAIKEQAYEKEVGEKLAVLRNADKVVYVVTDFFSLMDEDMDAIVADLLAETEGEKVLYTNYAEYANEQVRYRGEDMPEELLGVLR